MVNFRKEIEGRLFSFEYVFCRDKTEVFYVVTTQSESGAFVFEMAINGHGMWTFTSDRIPVRFKKLEDKLDKAIESANA